MRLLVVAGAIWLICSSADAEETSCPNEETLRSRYSTAPTEITFINDTGGTVRLYWINFEGERQLYAQLPTGQRVRQLTFVTHPWVVVDSEGRCLGVYRAARAPHTVQIASELSERVAQVPSSLRTREDTPEYRVVGVASDDTLNLRSEPDYEADILRQIPNDAVGIVGTGRKATVDGETWIEVIFDNVKGWVNSRYVAGLLRTNQASGARRSGRDKVPGVAD